MSKKLILFGDSHFGRCGRDLILQLEEKLIGEYDIYNCAAGGWNSADILRKSPYIADLKPDVIIISDGTNDANPARFVAAEDLKKNLKEIATTFDGSQIVFLPTIPANEALLAEEDKGFANTELEGNYQIVKDFCEQSGIKFVDSWPLFKPYLEKGENYHDPDGLHLDDHGYEILFGEIEKVLA